uniref:Uncharacterized protein n=1 Tax=Anguilla anguilla TaxID=7936 RepID=A0A0E9VBB5_ANGAN
MEVTDVQHRVMTVSGRRKLSEATHPKMMKRAAKTASLRESDIFSLISAWQEEQTK